RHTRCLSDWSSDVCSSDLAAALKGSTYYATNTLATGATLLSASLDNPSPTAARTVWLRVDVNDTAVTRQAVLAVTLANPAAPWRSEERRVGKECRVGGGWG